MFTTSHRHRVFILIIITQGVFLIVNAREPSWVDSAQSWYFVGAKQYDPELLEKTVVFISSKPARERETPKVLLLLGLIYWRRQLIAFCTHSSAEVNRQGKSAIETLNKAENAGADKYLTVSHKALVFQLLAGQSIKNGAIYGPRAAAELKKAQQANPRGYFSRLVEAVNVNQAPSFAGGNREKAVLLLEKMAVDFPDSVDVRIHLSDAYGKTGRTEEARRILTPVIKKHPANLLARKIADELPPE